MTLMSDHRRKVVKKAARTKSGRAAPVEGRAAGDRADSLDSAKTRMENRTSGAGNWRWMNQWLI
jgi:hypothetical protein